MVRRAAARVPRAPSVAPVSRAATGGARRGPAHHVPRRRHALPGRCAARAAASRGSAARPATARRAGVSPTGALQAGSGARRPAPRLPSAPRGRRASKGAAAHARRTPSVGTASRAARAAAVHRTRASGPVRTRRTASTASGAVRAAVSGGSAVGRPTVASGRVSSITARPVRSTRSAGRGPCVVMGCARLVTAARTRSVAMA